MILNGDAIEHMKEIEDNSIDSIVTDPPYFLPAQHYQTRTKFKRNFSDLGILESFFREFFSEAERIVRKTGHILIFCDGQSYPLFYYYLYFFSKAVRPIIWDKKTSINGYGWRHQHEIIIWAEMPGAKKIATGDGDIIRFNAVPIKERLHPAQKPFELLRMLVKKHTPPNGLVLDPFMGSGTTGMAAKAEGFRFIGIEKEKEYIDIAEKRIAATIYQGELGITA